MSPVIRISDTTFQRLQKYAAPFVDTPETVIRRLLESYEAGGHQNESAATHTSIDVDGPFDPDNHPDLHHTRVISAEFDGRAAGGWNDLTRVAHERAMETFGSFEGLCPATLSNILNGHHARDGYHYVAKPDISIQYTDANMAWRNSLHLARALGCPLEVQFEWRNKAGAAFPGKTGVLSWNKGESQE
jgi:hypothetical protein